MNYLKGSLGKFSTRGVFQKCTAGFPKQTLKVDEHTKNQKANESIKINKWPMIFTLLSMFLNYISVYNKSTHYRIYYSYHRAKIFLFFHILCVLCSVYSQFRTT